MTELLYARVSTTDQNLKAQITKLTTSYPNGSLFTDKQSGKNMDRAGFKKMMDAATAGDKIVVQDLTRLGRGTADLLTFIEELEALKVDLVIMDMDGKGQTVDTSSPMGKLMFTLVAAMGQMQREQIVEKTKLGIAQAKADGKFKGKQVNPATIAKCEKAITLISKGLTKEQAAKASDVGVATLYRFIKQKVS